MGRVEQKDFANNNGNKLEDVLQSDEEIIIELAPQKADFILESFLKGLPIVVIWVLIDIFIFSQFARIGTSVDKKAMLCISFILVFHLFPLWLYLYRLFKRIAVLGKIKYYFTNKRIIVKSGIIGTDYKFFTYPEVLTADVKIGLLDKIFRVGDIYITASNKSVVIEDIKNPYQYSNAIFEAIRLNNADTFYKLKDENNKNF